MAAYTCGWDWRVDVTMSEWVLLNSMVKSPTIFRALSQLLRQRLDLLPHVISIPCNAVQQSLNFVLSSLCFHIACSRWASPDATAIVPVRWEKHCPTSHGPFGKCQSPPQLVRALHHLLQSQSFPTEQEYVFPRDKWISSTIPLVPLISIRSYPDPSIFTRLLINNIQSI